MPVGYEQDVQLRIRTTAQGSAEVGALSDSVENLSERLTDATAAAQRSAAAQGDAAERVAQAQQRLDDVRLSLQSAQNEYKFLRDRSKEAGVAQELFAQQAENAKSRVAALKEELSVARAEVRQSSKDYKDAGAQTRAMAREQDALAASLRRTKDAIASAGDAAAKASFDKLGIRSAGAIEAEILAINQSLQTLARSGATTGAEFDRAFAAAQQRIAALRAELAGAPEQVDVLTRKVGMLHGVFGQLAAMYGGLQLAQEFIKANVAMETMERTFTQMKGSGQAAAEEIEYLRKTANRLGLDIESTSKAYVSLMAASKGTSLEGQKTRDIFEAVAGSMSKLGKSSADTEGALQAVAQMMGKGTVSMEELRQQLAERLPGAMQATADAAGITVSELVQMVSSGQVLANDLLPKLAQGLNKMYGTAGQVDGSISSWNRLKNAVFDTMVVVGNSGAWKLAVGGIEGLTIVVRGLLAMFDAAGISFASLAYLIANFDWKNPSKSFEEFTQRGIEASEQLRKKYGAVSDGQDQIASSSEAVSKSAESQSSSFLSLAAAYAQAAKNAANVAQVAEKNVDAIRAENAAHLDFANALGNTIEKREAGLRAAESEARALEMLAKARNVEAGVARSNAIALEEAAKAEGVVTEERRKAIEAAKQSAEVKEKESAAAASAATAAQNHAAALAAETLAVADNSSRVSELKKVWEDSVIAYQTLKAAKDAGIATEESLRAAELAAGQAAYLYRDALNDQTVSIENNARVKQATMSVEMAGVRLAIEQQRSIMETARARGDEATAIQAVMEIKHLEIKLAELTAQAKRAEAEAALAVVAAKREELIASGQMTAAKEKELQAAEAGARAKMVESQIAGETAKRMRELADLWAEMPSAAERGASGFEIIGDAAKRATGEVNRLGDAMRVVTGSSGAGWDAKNRIGYTSNGGNGTDGFDKTSILDDPDIRKRQGRVDYYQYLVKAGASMQEAEVAMKYFGELYRRGEMTQLTGNLGTSENRVRRTNALAKSSAEQALEYARQEMQSGQAVDMGTSADQILAYEQARNPTRASTGDGGVQKQISMIKRAGQQASMQPVKVHKVELSGGGRSATLFAENEQQVKEFVDVLTAHKNRASSR